MGQCCTKGEKDTEGHESLDLQSIFHEFDLDGDGAITQAELTKTLKRLGLNPTSLEVNAMFVAADKNRDGKIEFDEFETLIRQSPALRSLQHAFQQFDLDRDGEITEDELIKVITQLGQNIPAAEAQAMFKAADVNRDGRINFQEFAQLMKHHPLVVNLREVFRQFDADDDGYISLSELRSACQQLDVPTGPKEVATMFTAADTNKDGKISFEDISTIFDVDDDGYNSLSELRSACQQLDVPTGPKEVANIFAAADTNKDGKISFEKFCSLLTRKQGLTPPCL